MRRCGLSVWPCRTCGRRSDRGAGRNRWHGARALAQDGDGCSSGTGTKCTGELAAPSAGRSPTRRRGRVKRAPSLPSAAGAPAVSPWEASRIASASGQSNAIADRRRSAVAHRIACLLRRRESCCDRFRPRAHRRIHKVPLHARKWNGRHRRDLLPLNTTTRQGMLPASRPQGLRSSLRPGSARGFSCRRSLRPLGAQVLIIFLSVGG